MVWISFYPDRSLVGELLAKNKVSSELECTMLCMYFAKKLSPSSDKSLQIVQNTSWIAHKHMYIMYGYKQSFKQNIYKHIYVNLKSYKLYKPKLHRYKQSFLEKHEQLHE